MNEIWLPTVNANYEVSNLGNIRNVKTNKQLKPYATPKGYLGIELQGKWYSVHRLVAIAFIPNLDSLPQVNHLDKDRANNCVDNLEWITNSDNMEHGRAMIFYFRDSNSKVHQIYNLNKFCRDNSLPVGNMHRLWTGKHKCIKGWTRASAEDFL